MAKIHITDDGRILPCSAEKQECEYAKNETSESPRHYEESDRASAEIQLAKFMKEEHGYFPKTERKMKAREKSPNTFEESTRNQDISIGLLNDRFGLTPNPNTMTQNSAFANFNNLLAQ